MSKRVYIGRLPREATKGDIEKFFDGYGKILDCRVMNGFGFVEFENAKDADDVVNTFNGQKMLNEPVIVEHAKETRRERNYDGGGAGGDRGQRAFQKRPGFRVLLHGLSRDTSWQDLKDFGREAGSVTFSDVDRDGEGVLEYLNPGDVETAIRTLDGRELRGSTVRLTAGESGPAGGRNGDAGGRDREYRRERSRSPRREVYDRGGRRSPPPRRDYDDRRAAPYEDRRRDDRETRREERFERPDDRTRAVEDRPARFEDRSRYEERPPRYEGRRDRPEPPVEDRRNGDDRETRRPYEERRGYDRVDEDRPRRDDRRATDARDDRRGDVPTPAA